MSIIDVIAVIFIEEFIQWWYLMTMDIFNSLKSPGTIYVLKSFWNYLGCWENLSLKQENCGGWIGLNGSVLITNFNETTIID